MKKILACLAVLVPLVSFGQSASMLSMAQAELQKRGLNETEVRTRLMKTAAAKQFSLPEMRLRARSAVSTRI